MEAKKLTPVVELIKNSFRIYFKSENLAYLVKVLLVMYLILGLLLAPVIIPSVFYPVLFDKGFQGLPSWLIILLIGLAFLVFTLVFIVGFWMQTTLITAVSQVVKGEIIGIKETLSRGWRKIWKFVGTSLLSGIITMLGFAFLIIPGIIFSVWFSFATFIVVIEGRGVTESLKESEALVSGYFWPVLARFIVFGLLILIVQVAAGFIPFIGPVIVMFLTPYYLLLPYLVYEDLRRVKG